MTNFLIRLFVKNKDSIQHPETRKQYGIDITNRLIAAINLLEGAANLKDILALKQY